MGCPVPNCSKDAPERGIFCTDHYFKVPRALRKIIFRMDFRMERAGTNEDLSYFEGQKQGYIAQAVRALECQAVLP